MTKYRYGYKDCIQKNSTWFDRMDGPITVMGVVAMTIVGFAALKAIVQIIG